MKEPWAELNAMQVVGAVGFQGKRLDLENNKICPEMKELLKRCFSEKSSGRPSFLECCERTKEIAHLIHEKKTKLCGCGSGEKEQNVAIRRREHGGFSAVDLGDPTGFKGEGCRGDRVARKTSR